MLRMIWGSVSHFASCAATSDVVLCCWPAGIALRVPTPNVSVVDLVLQVEKKTFAEEVNEAFREAARGPSKGKLAHLRSLTAPFCDCCAYSYEPTVCLEA